jgi:uncharacterized protein YjbI with pentapeptide repeats
VRSGGITGNFTSARQYYAMNGGFLVGPSVNLWYEDLSGLNLTGQNLWGAQLSYANFTGANLTNANLASGLTQNTNFNGANLDRTSLIGTILTGAKFNSTSLATAKLGGMLRSGSLVGSPVMPSGYRMVAGWVVGPNVSLWQADLSNQDLTGINLTNTSAFQTNLTNTVLNNATVTNADLRAIFSNTTGTGLVGNPAKITSGRSVVAGVLS